MARGRRRTSRNARAGAPGATRTKGELARAWGAYQQNRFADCLRITRAVIAKQPGDADALYMHGLASVQSGLYEEGIESLERTLRLRPDDAEACRTLGFAYKSLGRSDEARRVLDEFLNRKPDSQPVLATKARLLMDSGEPDEAGRLLEPAVRAGIRDNVLAVVWGEYCKRSGRAADAMPELERQLERPELYPAARVPLLYLLGDLHDRLGQYDAAFEWYQRANAARDVGHDPVEHSLAVRSMLNAFSPAAFERIPETSHEARDSEVPVFIVGMPRSGTSLIEQILASHPLVHGAGELETLVNEIVRLETPLAPRTPHLPLHPGLLSQITIDAIARVYHETISAAAPDAARVTDKMPGNVFYLPVIRRLFPLARIIHCVRDPRDTGLSCYFHNFIGLTYVNDLAHIGAMIRDERDCVRHFTANLGIELLTVRYEDVVADLEGQTRRLLDHVGLDWDDRCLRFHETKRDPRTLSAGQVQQPIYSSSIGRWRHYERHLAPLVEAAGPEVMAPYV